MGVAIGQGPGQYYDDVEILADALWYLAVTEKNISDLLGDPLPDTDPSKAQVAAFTLSLIGEVNELAEELVYAPWKQRKVVNKERVLDEFADILAFLGILVVLVQAATDVEFGEIAQAAADKFEVNLQRAKDKLNGKGKWS